MVVSVCARAGVEEGGREGGATARVVLWVRRKTRGLGGISCDPYPRLSGDAC